MSGRRRMWLSVGGAVGVISAAALLYVLVGLSAAGAFDEIEPRGIPARGSAEGFVGGTEDLVFRADGKRAFVSSADFRNPAERGAIYLVDVQRTLATPVEVSKSFEGPFMPHGIDLWKGDDGERLFVVNHGDGHSVEVFDVALDGALEHVRTVRGDALISPNDVAAASADTFYVTNDHGSSSDLFRGIEESLRLPLANVVFWDGDSFSKAAGGLRFANGIAVHHDQSKVFVAQTTAGKLSGYRRDATTGKLDYYDSVPGIVGIDNLSIDATGVLWAGAHPQLLKFLEHAKDGEALSPSKVWRFWDIGRYEEVWVDDGSTASGVSVAARGDGFFVVGTVFQPKLVVFGTTQLSND